jgi:hypothetical protein
MEVLYCGEKMEMLSFVTTQHQYYIPGSKVDELCALPSPDQNKSPKITKTASNKRLSLKAQQAQQAQQAQAQQETFDRKKLPVSPVNAYGITDRLLAWFEVRVYRS